MNSVSRIAAVAGIPCLFLAFLPGQSAESAPFATTSQMPPAGIAQAIPVKLEAGERAGSKRSNAAFKKALALARKGKYSEAFRHADRAGGKAARKVIEWLYVQGPRAEAGFKRISGFIKANPDWPRIKRIRSRAELALYVQPVNPARTIEHFKAFPPQTGVGRIALARAYLKTGDKAKAAKWVRKAWRESSIPPGAEKKIIREMGKMITRDDRRHRLSRMIYKQDTKAATRAARFLPKSYRTLARSAVAFLRVSRHSRKRYGQVPKALRTDLALTYARIRWMRKRGKDATARTLLLKMPTAHSKIIDPEAWWIERRLLARAALRPGKKDAHRAAYRLTKAHGFTSGKYFVEAEFLSGWISKRFLGDSKTALRHFKKLKSDATLPATIARAEYWLGRSHATLGNPVKAKQHYEAASKQVTTYYGQLARDELKLPAPKNAFDRRPGGSEAVRAAVHGSELAQATRMLAKAGRSDLADIFLSAMAYNLKTKGERAALAQLAWNIGAPHRAVRIARIAGRFGQNLGRYAFPTSLLPLYKNLARSVERSLIYGLIRQESEFNITARSHVGAQGLMQIMPGTARMIARDHKQPYSKSRLTREPAYNLTLGTVHIQDLLKAFNGSYIMTVAAYNAGAGRPVQWMERYGDPRKGEIDPIDWVESIPFTETRKYVQRVLPNVQIYRTLFAEDKATRLTEDLHRGSKVRRVEAAGCSTKSGEKTIESLIACSN